MTTAATSSSPTRASVLLDPRWIAAAGAASISLTAVFTKLAETSPSTVIFFRCLIALPPLALLMLLEFRRHGMPARRVVAIQAVGGIFLGIDFALWTQSIMMIGAGVATIINNVQVLVVPLLAWLFYRDRLSLRFVMSVPLMFIGIALASGAFGSGDAESENVLAGTLLCLASGIAYAVYIIIVGRTGSKERANSQVFISTLAAGIAGTGVGMFWGSVDFTPGWGTIGWLTALALSGQVLGWVLIGSALPKLSAAVGSSLLLLQPVLAVFFSMLLIGERPSLVQLLGCAITIVGVWFVSQTPAPAPDRPDDSTAAPAEAPASAASPTKQAT